MPTKKKQAQSNQDSGDEDYRKKRDRNNQVRKITFSWFKNKKSLINKEFFFIRLLKDPDLSPNKKLKKHKVEFSNLRRKTQCWKLKSKHCQKIWNFWKHFFWPKLKLSRKLYLNLTWKNSWRVMMVS